MSGLDLAEEAIQWCRETLVMDSICVVVGLGSGLHVAEMVKHNKMKKIYVVDNRPELMDLFQKQYPELHNIVEVIIAEDSDSLLTHELMTEVIEHNMSSLAFSSCWPKTDLFFKNCHRHLSGRSKESLELFFNAYGIKKDIQIQDESGNRYLNIRDLEMMIQEDVPPYLRLNCFRILKELIL